VQFIQLICTIVLDQEQIYCVWSFHNYRGPVTHACALFRTTMHVCMCIPVCQRHHNFCGVKVLYICTNQHCACMVHLDLSRFLHNQQFILHIDGDYIYISHILLHRPHIIWTLINFSHMHAEIYTEDITTLPRDMMHVRSFIKDMIYRPCFSTSRLQESDAALRCDLWEKEDDNLPICLAHGLKLESFMHVPDCRLTCLNDMEEVVS
jgi:hypothetical protein